MIGTNFVVFDENCKKFLSGFISFSRLFLCVFCFNPSIRFYEQLGLFLFSLLFGGKSASRVVQKEKKYNFFLRVGKV